MSEAVKGNIYSSWTDELPWGDGEPAQPDNMDDPSLVPGYVEMRPLIKPEDLEKKPEPAKGW